MNNSLEARIRRLKEDRRAVILAHNYQLPEVQEIADFTGDSLELSRQATKVQAEVIVFCGVSFMAETAKILNPEKIVLLPDPHAGCPMADMITADQLRELKQKHPSAKVVCYVNSTAEVKAECDICCTSSNAVAVVNSLDKTDEIIFVPDQYLGQHVIGKTGRPMILWNGYCPTHMRIGERDIQRLRQSHSNAIVMVHPECSGPAKAAADQVLSTGAMCQYAKTSPADEFIIGTEIGILHRLQKENPQKRFYPVSERAECPNMKKITLEKVLWSLERMEYPVTVPQDIREKAYASLKNMLDLAG